MNLPGNADNNWDLSRCRAAEGARMWWGGRRRSLQLLMWAQSSAWTDRALPRTAAGTLIWNSWTHKDPSLCRSLLPFLSRVFLSCSVFMFVPLCLTLPKSLQALAAFLQPLISPCCPGIEPAWTICNWLNWESLLLRNKSTAAFEGSPSRDERAENAETRWSFCTNNLCMVEISTPSCSLTQTGINVRNGPFQFGYWFRDQAKTRTFVQLRPESGLVPSLDASRHWITVVWLAGFCVTPNCLTGFWFCPGVSTQGTLPKATKQRPHGSAPQLNSHFSKLWHFIFQCHNLIISSFTFFITQNWGKLHQLSKSMFWNYLFRFCSVYLQNSSW